MTTTQVTGPTALSARALGPDLARGFMLLFIALANSHYFLRGDSYRGGFPMDGSDADSAVTWLIATFVDNRAFPMFGLLFGYGVAQIVRRNVGLDARSVRRLLRRRSLVLIVVGFLHAVLLYIGDILAAYGILLLLGVWVVRWRDRWLLIGAGLYLAIGALPIPGAASTSAAPPDPTMLPPDLITQLADRALVQPLLMLLFPISFVCPFLIGIWAGRRRILERPEQYLALLRVTAVVGIAIAVIGAQPVSLMLVGVVPVPSDTVLGWIGPLHDASGILGGFGYAALVALLAHRLGRRSDQHGPVVTAIAAAGQRSMTCYLAQSPVWAVVFTPYLLDLSGTLTVTSTALLATATWLNTVLLADRMRRHGNRGPFELLVRRVTYRTRPTSTNGARRDSGLT